MITNQPLSKTQQAMASLLDFLDVQKANGQPDDLDRRAEARRTLRAPCEITMFSGLEPTVEVFHGTTRNLSFLGLSVVLNIRSSLPFKVGRPVEVCVCMNESKKTHLAGTVAFCRSIEEECQEVGVAVMAAGESEILTHDVARARSLYGWFTEGLQLQAD
jgi:hypothetical protein